MKHYPPDEYQHCLAAARSHRAGTQEGGELHQLLMEQRALAADAAYRRGFMDGARSARDQAGPSQWDQFDVDVAR